MKTLTAQAATRNVSMFKNFEHIEFNAQGQEVVVTKPYKLVKLTKTRAIYAEVK